MAAVAEECVLDPWITQVRTRRGATICMRPLRADDRQREIAYLEGLSPRSRYLRLFVMRKDLPEYLIDQLMDIDYRQRMALAATTNESGLEQLVGVARYGASDEPGAAEFAVSVADAWQRSGIATALMKQLVCYARGQRIRRLTGQVLPDNHAMIALARRLGFTVSYDPAQHAFRISLDLDREWRSRVG
jgi:RimJ/RimL family protein N-acetyltransferase